MAPNVEESAALKAFLRKLDEDEGAVDDVAFTELLTRLGYHEETVAAIRVDEEALAAVPPQWEALLSFWRAHVQMRRLLAYVEHCTAQGRVLTDDGADLYASARRATDDVHQRFLVPFESRRTRRDHPARRPLRAARSPRCTRTRTRRTRSGTTRDGPSAGGDDPPPLDDGERRPSSGSGWRSSTAGLTVAEVAAVLGPPIGRVTALVEDEARRGNVELVDGRWQLTARAERRHGNDLRRIRGEE